MVALICLRSEVRDAIDPEKWHGVDVYRKNPFYGTEFPAISSFYGPKSFVDNRKHVVVPLYKDQDLELYKLLAGVDGLSCRDVPCAGFDRGLPQDISAEVQLDYERDQFDAFSQGYATLAELKQLLNDFPRVRMKIMVPVHEAIRTLKTHRMPKAYCGSTNSRDYIKMRITRGNSGLEKLIRAVEKRLEEVNLSCYSGHRLSDSDIRVVFWFVF